MSYLLKDLYSHAFYERLSDVLAMTVPGFDHQRFMSGIFDQEFAGKELKDRMKHTSKVLHGFLPVDYAERVALLTNIIHRLRAENFGEDSLVFMFLPDYVETYGIDHYEVSIKALENITQFVSCEIAVRPFLLKYGDKMRAQMHTWSLHENHKVRRLASEGSRPRLPWAMAVPALKKNPAPILALLENLKHDPSEWVRRSVANNLNDIAKDYPELVLDVAHKWQGYSKETDAIIKHGCRTLLKQGHPTILKHYGLQSENISLSNFKILTPEVKVGGDLQFSFSIQNNSTTPQTVRLEYAIYYPRKNGVYSKKVFKISERPYAPEAQIAVLRKQSFKLITTRTFYAGQHRLTIIVNGEEKGMLDFMLEAIAGRTNADCTDQKKWIRRGSS